MKQISNKLTSFCCATFLINKIISSILFIDYSHCRSIFTFLLTFTTKCKSIVRYMNCKWCLLHFPLIQNQKSIQIAHQKAKLFQSRIFLAQIFFWFYFVRYLLTLFSNNEQEIVRSIASLQCITPNYPHNFGIFPQEAN